MTETHKTALAACGKLARIQSTDQSDVEVVLQHVSELNQVDVEGIEPMMHPHQDELRLRKDTPQVGLSQEQALGRAPQQAEGAFAVPAVLKLSE